MTGHYRKRALPPLYGRAIFAEDARLELGGQFSLIGCFPVGLSGGEFPFTIQKLAILVEITAARDLDPKDLTVKVFLPGSAEDAPLFEASIEMGEADHTADTDATPPFPGERINRHVVLNVVPNVVIERAGEIRVRAFYGDEYIAIGSLPIKSITPAEADRPE